MSKSNNFCSRSWSNVSLHPPLPRMPLFAFSFAPLINWWLEELLKVAGRVFSQPPTPHPFMPTSPDTFFFTHLILIFHKMELYNGSQLPNTRASFTFDLLVNKFFRLLPCFHDPSDNFLPSYFLFLILSSPSSLSNSTV